MGFYGNITNVSRTQFQFDKIYPNRHEMEVGKLTDGVFLGRYVLIEYDSDYHLDTFLRVQMENGRAYYNPEGATGYNTLLTKGLIKQNELVYTSTSNLTPDTGLSGVECTFYKCTSNFIEGSAEPATFEVISSLEGPAYTDNYHIDTTAYGAGRGYDSTVWQKVFTDGVERYVMIAELNTVVPTFSVVAEAPTMNPVVPHFDTKSTDVYYKLHWQAPWGFRVGAASAEKSDTTTQWTTTRYNPATGTNETLVSETKPAAIYYNAKAFKAFGENGEITKHDDTTADEIKILPVSSGQAIYDDHNPATTDPISAPDIQEMTINLPAIGNMMSDAWDIIHGPNRDNDMREIDPETGNYVASLKGRLLSIDAIDENQIPIKRIDNGQLVGTKINGDVRDTTVSDTDEILSAELSSSYESDDAWIETKVDADNTPNAIAIHHTYHAAKSSVSEVDLNNHGYDRQGGYFKEGQLATYNHKNDNDDVVNLYVPYVDAAGHVVGHNIETVTLPYSYKSFNSVGASVTDGADIYTTITESADGNHTSAANPVNSETIADQTQDTMSINPYNKWIQVKLSDDNLFLAHEIHAVDMMPQATNLNTDNVASSNATDKLVLQDIAFDKAGHVIQNRLHTYTLPYGFKTIKTNGRSTEVSENATGTPSKADIVAENTQDALTINSGNKWVRIDTNATNDTITIRHDVHKTSSTNNTTDWTKTEVNTTIPTVTYVYDEAGHYVSHHTENYKLPFGYGKIKGDNSTSTTATATYDELSIVTGDDWLTSAVSTDTVTITHDFKAVTDTTSTVDKNIVTEDKDIIKLYTPIVDDKGHVVGKNTETVTLPFGYKTFTGDSGSSSASNTQDSMSVTGDNWIGVTVANDTIQLAHKTAVVGSVTTATPLKPDFGEAFKFVTYDFDANGHKYGDAIEHEVTIPLPSLTSGTGNVVTGLSLTPSTGALTETKANLGAIKLGTYEPGDSAADLTDDITLQQALSRLQNKINNEITNRQTAIEALDVTDVAVDGQYVSAVSETDGIITVARQSLPVYTLTSGSVNGTIAFNNSDVQVTGLGSAAYTNSAAYDAAGAASTAEQNAKNYADSLANNYATAAQGIKADSALQLDTEFSIPDGDDGAMAVATIPQLFAYIRDLQTQVSNLQIEVNRLSAFHPVEDNITTEE